MFAISEHESSFGRAQDEQGQITFSDNDSSDCGKGDTTEAEMAIAQAASNSPAGSAMTQSSDSAPAKG